MNNKVAFILECEINKDIVLSSGYSFDQVVIPTGFGQISGLYLKNPINGKGAFVFENGGMSGKYILPETSAPVFHALYMNNVNNLYLLGFTGSLNKSNKLNSFLIPSDFIDMTRNRKRSFIEQVFPGELFFYRMAKPYSSELQDILMKALNKLEIIPIPNQTLLVTEGPRFETASEINAYGYLGGDCVCFSGAPDASYARELGINFAIGLYVSNYAEGLSQNEIENILNIAVDQTNSITRLVIQLMESNYDLVSTSYHDEYWMQKPSDVLFKKLKNKNLK